MEYKSLHGFILFVLLHEGKSNLRYLISRFIFGEKIAIRRYFKILFKGCDNGTFLYLQNQYKKETNIDLYIKVVVDSNNILTGEVL